MVAGLAVLVAPEGCIAGDGYGLDRDSALRLVAG